jgi:hypothetical protein
MQLIALQGAIPAVTSMFPQILVVSGHSAFVMRNGLFALAIVPLGLLFGARYGVSGVAAAWFLLLPLVRGPLFWRTRATIGLSTRRLARTLWPAASSVIVMAAAVFTLSTALAPRISTMPLFASKVMIGALAYGGMLALAHRDRVREVIGALRAMRARPVPADDSSSDSSSIGPP